MATYIVRNQGGFLTMRKQLLTVFLAFIVMLVGITAAIAVDDAFTINSVQVDDIKAVPGGNAVFVERGQDTIIEVYLTGNEFSDDVRVKAYIGGYEYDDVEAISDIFEVEPGVDYRKVLRLSVPEDLDASDDYTLYVKVYDGDNEIQEDYVLRIQEARHDVVIQDVIVRPGTSIEAGRPLFVTVRAENLGSRKEEDIKVTASIPELGISARDYIDELAANEDSDNNEDNEDEESSQSSDELFLRIPDDATTGDYELVVTVEYSRGHKTVSETQTIHVSGSSDSEGSGSEGTGSTQANAIVTVDSTSKTAKAGEEVAYRVMIANMDKVSRTFSLEVAGEQLFAEAVVEPAFVTVPADGTGEIIVYVTPNEDAKEGRNSFTARVKTGSEIVSEVSLTTNVEQKGLSGDLKQALIIGLIVLVVILIILGLIVAFSRMKGDDDLGAGEGQSYYYYPRY